MPGRTSGWRQTECLLFGAVLEALIKIILYPGVVVKGTYNMVSLAMLKTADLRHT